MANNCEVINLRQLQIVVANEISVDITYLKEKTLTDLDNLPNHDVLADEIALNLKSVLISSCETIAQLKT
jgi:type I restriction enzyme M protein